MEINSSKQTRRFALIGMFGALLCSVGDYLLEYLGRESQTLGSFGVIESAWADMALWRFHASVWLGCIGITMYALGFIAIIRHIRSTHRKLGNAFAASAMLGMLGGVFIHVILCVMPIGYKYLLENAGQELAVATVDAMTASFIGPFFIFYALLMIVPLILWIVYSFKKSSLYSPAATLTVVVLSIGCMVIGALVPSLEWVLVGAVSRMLAAWCLVAYIYELRREKSAQ